ncbi:acyl carrier protein [Photorhabdus sp. HUG-39]|uniref:Acyl carrier protein n=1 Tax=Photorhabdus kayaii TaxID=230088 RepID=A0ABX0AWP7_9GAMM|nr:MULTISPECIES: stilbene biosynthesis acyl carrier protein StlE [Photorhabdus]MCC8373692.1 stilbene biosynthesis acyl carrier protein StlE [Photorhabdus bodei]MDB6367383.1 stilbene biosynthesis acyl carrier protein StlE [Photorhabdus bodei]NDL10385.1 stilbene biosynthesis acyl carrier protein StlE [Photorhabdus kayaii]NDL23743.1 stilbene biosynthesis acyl carrier protein StlE [Photorhabdus kayaii]RAX12354.1 acyl carrier protein [Photorhabdus sp. HUG-39]
MENLENRVKSVVAEQLGIPETQILNTQTFEELGADSLDNVELIMALEEHFGITIDDEEAEKIVTIQNAIDCIDSKLKSSN